MNAREQLALRGRSFKAPSLRLSWFESLAFMVANPVPLTPVQLTIARRFWLDRFTATRWRWARFNREAS